MPVGLATVDVQALAGIAISSRRGSIPPVKPNGPYLSQPSARRSFLGILVGTAALGGAFGAAEFLGADSLGGHTFKTRGVVLIPDDLTWPEWPERAAHAGLTTIALHHGSSVFEVIQFIESERGSEFTAKVRKLGLQMEFELHAMSDLLPRSLFDSDKSLFRMNEGGERSRESNLCVHSAPALEIVAENAVAISRRLHPSTGRYFFWGDDGAPWCRCRQCGEFTDSEQAVLLENHLIKELRRVDPRAQLAHLAYANTLAPPKKIRPAPEIFLEYAPINRRYNEPYARQTGGGDAFKNLDANLAVFPSNTAQILEYWLDVSRFSGWRRPAKKLPWNREVFLADLNSYAARGIKNVTSFACYIDADYLKLYGEPAFLAEYGRVLNGKSGQ
jgi:hypothetical protein